MKIEVIDVTRAGLSMVRISHGDASLNWDVSAYSRTLDRNKSVDVARLFDEINAFWETVPKATLDAIWDIYRQIFDIMQYNTDVVSTKNRLQELIKELYDNISLDDIRHWVLFRSNLKVPPTIKSQYGENDLPESTYLREDYQDLVALTIALRPMVPIWGEYIGASRREVGNDYKEYEAMKLLYLSNLNASVPMERLKVYINDRVEHVLKSQSNITVILSGMGTTEIPDWVMAMSVVRRLATTDVKTPNDGSSIISNVFKFVVNAMTSMDKRMGKKLFGGKISEKSSNAQSGDDSTNASLVENYKVKQEVADGDLIVLSVYTEQYLAMARNVDPTVPEDYLRICADHVTNLENSRIYQGAITLVQWVMAPCLPARGVPLLPKPALLRTLAATQAILWHWGFHDLAALVTAIPHQSNNDNMLNPLESRSRIPKDLTDELVQLFPFNRAGRAKQQTVRLQNEVYKAIDLLCDIVTKNDWMLTAPDELVEKTSRIPSTRRMIIPADIRIQLAKLVIRFTKERSQLA